LLEDVVGLSVDNIRAGGECSATLHFIQQGTDGALAPPSLQQ